MPYVLKEEGKPSLFSFDLETELRYIEKTVYDNKRYSLRDLDNEYRLLKDMAVSLIEIIQDKEISGRHLDLFEHALLNGPSGVWETASDKLEILSYHFPKVKERILTIIQKSQTRYLWKALSPLNQAFSPEEQFQVISEVINRDKSSGARKMATEIALRLRSGKNEDMLRILCARLEVEKNAKVREAIHFTIKNMHQEP